MQQQKDQISVGFAGQGIRGLMTVWALVPLLVSVGCTNAAADAEKRYQMVERNGSKGELCIAAREVENAYLRAGNEKQYGDWHLVATQRCQSAELVGPDTVAQENDISRRAQAEAEADARAAMKDAQAAASGN